MMPIISSRDEGESSKGGQWWGGGGEGGREDVHAEEVERSGDVELGC